MWGGICSGLGGDGIGHCSLRSERATRAWRSQGKRLKQESRVFLAVLSLVYLDVSIQESENLVFMMH